MARVQGRQRTVAASLPGVCGMMVTVDEAKTKICPQTLIQNRPMKCIGPECMAWRHLPDRTNALHPVINFGWCGLAGRPEYEVSR